MTFYFKPPRGNIELEKMLDCLQQRLDFISSLKGDEDDVRDPLNLSYFVEGTAIDRASHYLLRLVSLQHHSFQEHVLIAETALFQRRLSFCDPSHLEIILNTCKRHSDELLNTKKEIKLPYPYSQFLEAVKNLCWDILRKTGGLKHAFANTHSESCTSMFIRVPFRICLKLIASRKTELRSGEALVPCGIWKQLLVEVFRQHLLYGYEDMLLSGCHREALADPRILQLKKMMSFNYTKKFEFGGSSHRDLKSDLTCQRLTERLRMFPPCVTSMLDALKKHHRIGHHARVALTLVLKESGMPLKEALTFWRSELSMPKCNHDGKHGSGCSHTWQKDEKKFTYSIRHLYGLEGARKNYAAPSCATFQGQLLAPGSLGGCPFNRLPEEKLVPILELYKCTQPAEVLTLARDSKPVQACQRLCQDCICQIPKASKAQLPAINFSKPSQFYSTCRDWSLEF